MTYINTTLNRPEIFSYGVFVFGCNLFTYFKTKKTWNAAAEVGGRQGEGHGPSREDTRGREAELWT